MPAQSIATVSLTPFEKVTDWEQLAGGLKLFADDSQLDSLIPPPYATIKVLIGFSFVHISKKVLDIPKDVFNKFYKIT